MNMFQSSESIGSPSVKFGSQAAVCDDAKSEMSCWRKFVQEAKRSVRCGVNGHMVWNMSLSLYWRAVKSKIRKIIRANLTVLRFRCYLSSEQVGFTIKVLPELYNDSVCVVCVCVCVSEMWRGFCLFPTLCTTETPTPRLPGTSSRLWVRPPSCCTQSVFSVVACVFELLGTF